VILFVVAGAVAFLLLVVAGIPDAAAWVADLVGCGPTGPDFDARHVLRVSLNMDICRWNAANGGYQRFRPPGTTRDDIGLRLTCPGGDSRRAGRCPG
jgi:hypothetical protein